MPRPVRECPGCGGRMGVRELGCAQCGIALRGSFEQCEFCALPEEQFGFLRLFVSRRGNLREVERELGVSYPTVRARLDDLLRSLGYQVSPVGAAERQERRRHILDQLRVGAITAEEALRALRD